MMGCLGHQGARSPNSLCRTTISTYFNTKSVDSRPDLGSVSGYSAQAGIQHLYTRLYLVAVYPPCQMPPISLT